MFYKILKLSENIYNVQRLDKDLKLVEVKSISSNDIVFKKYKELLEPRYNLFWYNSKNKLNWEVIN